MSDIAEIRHYAKTPDTYASHAVIRAYDSTPAIAAGEGLRRLFTVTVHAVNDSEVTVSLSDRHRPTFLSALVHDKSVLQITDKVGRVVYQRAEPEPDPEREQISITRRQTVVQPEVKLFCVRTTSMGALRSGERDLNVLLREGWTISWVVGMDTYVLYTLTREVEI